MANRAQLYHTVLENRPLGDSAFVLRFERRDVHFQPGQYLSVGCDGDLNMREYSIYSPTTADYLEILVKRVEGGAVSPKLGNLQPGDRVYVEGPFGFFTVSQDALVGKLLFVASGSGISPFHAMVQSLPGLDYRLLHGVRHLSERYDHAAFERRRLVSCVTGEEGGDFRGRVTEWIRQNPAETDRYCFLCGSCDMIYDMYDILCAQGIPADHIHAEVYF